MTPGAFDIANRYRRWWNDKPRDLDSFIWGVIVGLIVGAALNLL